MCFISSFLDDPCAAASTSTPNEITSCEWWAKGQEQYGMTYTTPSLSSTPSTANSPRLLPQAEFSRKRKKPTSPTTGNTTAVFQDKQRTVREAGKKGQEEFVEEGEVNMKLAGTGRKVQGKGAWGSQATAEARKQDGRRSCLIPAPPPLKRRMSLGSGTCYACSKSYSLSLATLTTGLLPMNSALSSTTYRAPGSAFPT